MERDELLEPEQDQYTKGNDLADLAQEKIDDFNQTLYYELKQQLEKIGFKGSRSQIYMQNALTIELITLTVATLLSMIISQINFLESIYTAIPYLWLFFLIIYASTIIFIQFSDWIKNQRVNFITGFLHALSKIFLIAHLTIWLFEIKIEVLLVAIVAVVGFIAMKIYIPTQRFEEARLDKSIIVPLIGFQSVISIFLTLLTRSSFKIALIIWITSVIFGVLQILSLKRFFEHEYLGTNSNDLYLGALQIEADIVLPCQLIIFHFKQNGQKSASSHNSNKSKKSSEEPEDPLMKVQEINSQNEI